MLEWIANQFAQLHQIAFEGAVLPLVYGAGLGAYAEQAFDWTEVFLIGAIEVTLLAVVMTALEKWRPVETQTDQAARRVDIIYTLLQRLGLIPLAMFLLLLPLVDGVDGWLRMHDIIPPKLEDALPFLNTSPLTSFVLYLLVLDFVGYWLHRWQHHFGVWWALHSLHHSQQQMNFWSDDRNHLLDNLMVDAIFAFVALLIGVPPAQFVTLVIASRIVQSVAHANLRVSFGRIGEYLLVSPRFHRVHHAIGVGHEGRKQGCNFAVLFPLWDVIFRTANFSAEFPKTGVRDQLEGRDYGRGFWAQQLLGLQRVGESLGLRRASPALRMDVKQQR
jgi:sterol desaturase/sphingolipid hydroxylase (fatty acid hydroxylase superfamily)